MAFAITILGAVILAFLVFGLFVDSEDPAAEVREKALQAESALKGRLLDAFQEGNPPVWRTLKAMAQETGVENERVPDVLRELSHAIVAGEVQAPANVLEAMQSYQRAHESEILLAAMPATLTLAAAQLLESLGAERGLAQPLMREIKTMEQTIANQQLEIQSLAIAVEAARPGCFSRAFSFVSAGTLIFVGVGMYYGWLELSLKF